MCLVAAVVALACGRAAAVDVELFGVAKGQAFVQSGTGAPTALSGSNYFFQASVRAKRFNTLFGARVRAGLGGADRPLSVGHDFDFFNQWSAVDFYPSQSALDAAHPDTNYVVTLNTVSDGQVTVAFNLTGSAYPNAPHVANFVAAQAIRPDVNFTLQWDAFSGGTTNDHIRVEFEDVPNTNNVPELPGPLGGRPFRTGDPRDVAGLDGTATSVVIPAGTLNLGHVYRTRITFTKVTSLDTNSYPQVTGVAGYAAKTEFPLHTVDVRSAGVVKGQLFQQSDATAPVSQGFAIQMFVDSRGPSLGLSNATVQLPNSGPTITLQATNDFEFKDQNSTSSGLDAAYPDGVYTATLTTVHDATKTFSLPVTNILAQMATPHISNYAAAQAVNPGKDFTLAWDALAGGLPADFVQLTLSIQTTNGSSDIFQTSEPLTPTALNGTSTSVTIPAFTLQPGTAYSGTLMYSRVTSPLDSATYPGALGIAGDIKRVNFNLRTPDVRYYSLSKEQAFLQTNTSAPVAYSPSNFIAHAKIKTPGTNNVTSATLTIPGTGPVPLDPTQNFELQTNFTSQSALDAFLPSGSYVFTINTVNDGTKTSTINVPATAFPNAPHVIGFDLLQLVNPHRPLLVAWDAFTGGTTNDHIRLEIQEANNPSGLPSANVYSSPRIGEPGALNGTNTAVVLPANTFKPGRDYPARLFFAKVCTLDTNSYPGADGGAAFVSSAAFNIHTRGSHPSAPIIGGIIRSNAQTFLNFLGETNRSHRIDFVTDLKLKNWTPLMTNGPTSDGSATVSDGAPSSVRSYRIVPLFQ